MKTENEIMQEMESILRNSKKANPNTEKLKEALKIVRNLTKEEVTKQRDELEIKINKIAENYFEWVAKRTHLRPIEKYFKTFEKEYAEKSVLKWLGKQLDMLNYSLIKDLKRVEL